LLFFLSCLLACCLLQETFLQADHRTNRFRSVDVVVVVTRISIEKARKSSQFQQTIETTTRRRRRKVRFPNKSSPDLIWLFFGAPNEQYLTTSTNTQARVMVMSIHNKGTILCKYMKVPLQNIKNLSSSSAAAAAAVACIIMTAVWASRAHKNEIAGKQQQQHQQTSKQKLCHSTYNE